MIPFWSENMMSCLFSLCVVGIGHAQVVTYEGDSYPDEHGWERIVDCTPTRSLHGGRLVEQVEIGECYPPPGGDRDRYEMPIESMVGIEDFFLEFRIMTSGDSTEFLGQAPTTVNLGSFGPVHYGFTVAKDRIKFFRDAQLPVLFFNIESEVAHCYRLELRGISSFNLFIDNVLVANGIPEGLYPSANPLATFRMFAYWMNSTTQLDYLRFGRMPDDGSGDYNSDGDVDAEDLYFFNECFGGANLDAGPGCRFADFDGDIDVDCADWEAFAASWSGLGEPPTFEQCSTGAIPTASTMGIINLAGMILVAAAIISRRRAANATVLDSRITYQQ